MPRHICENPTLCETCKKTRYMREWREKNRSHITQYADEYNKKYYEKNKEKINVRTSTYYEQNKDAVNARKKEYNKENEEYFRALRKKKWKENKHILGPKNKKYYYDHRDELIKKQMIYRKNKYHTDENYRMKECCSARIRGALSYTTNKKDTKTTDLVGCEIPFLWDHLEKQFLPGMTRQNFGSVWHIDHIIPCSHFDLEKTDEKLKCFNYKNLRPYYGEDNIRRGNHINYISTIEIELLMKTFGGKNE